MALILKGRSKLKGSTVIGKRPYAIDGVFNPELVFDFPKDYYRTNSVSKTFANAITHTRASTATYVDADGILQTAASGVPRIGYHVWNGSAWVNEGLLHESEARTNLLTYSEDASNAAWVKVAGITIGTPVTRKGISLDLIESNGAANFRDVAQSLGSVANNAYATFSCFVEAGTSAETAIRMDNAFGGVATARVSVPITWTSGVPSLQSAATLGATFVSASIQDFADGLYRISLTMQNTTGGALTFQARYYVQWDETAAAVNTYAGGFQAEIGPTPSSYIPTAGSAVTRAADVLTVPAANLPWNPLAVSIQMDGRVTYADEDTFYNAQFVEWEKDSSNKIEHVLSTLTTRTGQLVFSQLENSVSDTVSSATNLYSPDILVPYNIAARHGSTFVNGAIDGTALTANTTPVALPDLSATNLQLGFDYNGTIRTFRMWGQDITDAGLVEATS
jgi:hypothetical protein